MKILHSFCMSCPAVFIRSEFLVWPTMLTQQLNIYSNFLCCSPEISVQCAMLQWLYFMNGELPDNATATCRIEIWTWRNEWTKLTSHELQDPGAVHGRDFSICYVQARYGQEASTKQPSREAWNAHYAGRTWWLYLSAFWSLYCETKLITVHLLLTPPVVKELCKWPQIISWNGTGHKKM
jgi:hypothetical protein